MYIRYCCHSWGLQVRQKFHKKSNHGDFLYINEQVVTLQKFVMFLSVAIEKSWHLLSPGCALAQPSCKNQKVLSYFDWNIKFLTFLRDINATTISDVHESARRFLKAWSKPKIKHYWKNSNGLYKLFKKIFQGSFGTKEDYTIKLFHEYIIVSL